MDVLKDDPGPPSVKNVRQNEPELGLACSTDSCGKLSGINFDNNLFSKKLKVVYYKRRKRNKLLKDQVSLNSLQFGDTDDDVKAIKLVLSRNKDIASSNEDTHSLNFGGTDSDVEAIKVVLANNKLHDNILKRDRKMLRAMKRDDVIKKSRHGDYQPEELGRMMSTGTSSDDISDRSSIFSSNTYKSLTDECDSNSFYDLKSDIEEESIEESSETTSVSETGTDTSLDDQIEEQDGEIINYVSANTMRVLDDIYKCYTYYDIYQLIKISIDHCFLEISKGIDFDYVDSAFVKLVLLELFKPLVYINDRSQINHYLYRHPKHSITKEESRKLLKNLLEDGLNVANYNAEVDMTIVRYRDIPKIILDHYFERFDGDLLSSANLIEILKGPHFSKFLSLDHYLSWYNYNFNRPVEQKNNDKNFSTDCEIGVQYDFDDCCEQPTVKIVRGKPVWSNDDGDFVNHFSVKNRKKIRGKEVTLNQELLYFLRIKYFMSPRDPSIIQQMVSDARSFINKHNLLYNRNTFVDVTNTIIQAFIVNEQELIFRKVIKDNRVLDGVSHLNDTMAGDLGKSLFGFHKHSLIGNLLPTKRFPETSSKI